VNPPGFGRGVLEPGAPHAAVTAQLPEPDTAIVEGSVLVVEIAPEPAEG
jgi:hypothetical protein